MRLRESRKLIATVKGGKFRPLSIPPDVIRVGDEEHVSAQIQEDLHMRVVVFMSVTLDGVIQAPARPAEDIRGGFEHGGWAVPYAGEVRGTAAGRGMARPG